jgi:hypothetical protein
MKRAFVYSAAALLIISACEPIKKGNESAEQDSLKTPKSDSTAKAPEDKTKRESPPKQASFLLDGVSVSMNWGSPKVKGRVIWGELVPFDEVWRTGANEATTITFDQNAVVNGKDIPSGTYALFTILGKKEWTFIFNTRPEQWGSYEYEAEKDQLRITSKPEKNDMYESLEFEAENGKVYMKWEKMKVGFSVSKGK